MAAPLRIDELTALGSLSSGAAVAVVQGGLTLQVPASAFITQAPSFTQSGSGAVAETVQVALRKLVHEDQFGTEAQFLTALEAAVLASSTKIGFAARNIRLASTTIQSIEFSDNLLMSLNTADTGITVAAEDGTGTFKFNLFRKDVFASVGTVCQIGFEGKKDDGSTVIYAAIRGVQLDPATAAPQGGLRWYTIDGSDTLTERMSIDADGDLQLATGFVSAPTKVVGHSFGAATSSSTCLNLATAATTRSSLRVPHGTAPTSPVNGDIWTTTAGLFVRINGVTVGPLVA